MEDVMKAYYERQGVSEFYEQQIPKWRFALGDLTRIPTAGADRARMRGVLPRARLLWIVVPVAVFASTAHAAEGELEEAPPPSSAPEIRTPIQRITTEPPKRMPARFPWIQQQLDKLPPFFADTHLEARFRTYYLREDKTTDALSEAWAMGGSIYYRSGWLADLFQAEVEAFTSQPIVAPDSKDGTLLLQPVQDGYSVLGIANGKLRHKGIELTGGRVYLDMPYINRQDNRMTPNTFEAINLQKPKGEFQFTTGYAWNIKLRNSDDFVSFSEAAGVDEDRGLAWGGAIWDTSKNFHGGVWAGVVPDLAGKAYGELGVGRDLTGEWYGRIDGQFTYQFDIGDDLLGDAEDDTWILAIRAAASHAGAVFRVGMAFAGPNAFTGFLRLERELRRSDAANVQPAKGEGAPGEPLLRLLGSRRRRPFRHRELRGRASTAKSMAIAATRKRST